MFHTVCGLFLLLPYHLCCSDVSLYDDSGPNLDLVPQLCI